MRRASFPFRGTASRLAAALLGYIALIILLLTLNPFYLTLPRQIGFSFNLDPKDMIANIILFLPIGFLYRLTGGERLPALVLGAALSGGIETTQLFMPARTASFIDFTDNSLGAWLGAALYDLLLAHFTVPSGVVRRLRLETPLMGFLYLLVPLLWVNALTLADDSSRWILTALIGICGAIVLSELYRHWLEGRGPRTMGYASLAAAAWFLVGEGPTLRHPLTALTIGSGVMLLTAVLTLLPRSPADTPSADRRFELSTLKRVLPIFGLYLLLAALWPPLRPLVVWHGMFGLTSRAQDTSLQFIFPRVEYLAALTVLGYLTAEWRGRAEAPLRQDLPRLLLAAAGTALFLEALVGFQAGSGASLVRAVLVTFSALFGGVIYHLLRDHIRFLLRR